MDPTTTLLIAVTAPIALAALGFWIWMLVDCLNEETKEGNERLVWVVVIVATKLVGAIVYYFVRRRRRIRSAV